MGSSAAGATPLRACEVTAAMSLVHASVEDECHIFSFAESFREIGIRKGMTLVEATKLAVVHNFGCTNIGLMYDYALKNKLDVAGFLCMTDNEVNSGTHPALVLRQYREKFNPEAKSIMMGTTATGFTCNDPNDKFGLDVVGFDTNAPNVIGNFLRGNAKVVVDGGE
jgi:60 kDa SS-A/Ro ribonucleoprotein